MVVDDERAILNLLGRLLEKRGHKVQLCHAGTAALIDMPEPPPDGIITDINMLGTDGLTLARELRSTAKLKDIKIIAISGDTDDQTKAAAAEAGADAFIEKPINPATFSEQIEAILETP